MRARCGATGLLFLALAALPGPVCAEERAASKPGITLYVEEKTELRTPHYKQRWVFPGILGHDTSGKPYLKLDPEQDPKAREVIELLRHGVQFDQPKVRDEIAGILDRFPWQCKANMELILKVNPIEDIDAWVPNVTDNRRITIVAVNECLKETPKECRYCLCDEGGFDFPLGSLKRVLRDCQTAVDTAVKAGAAFSKPAGVAPLTGP